MSATATILRRHVARRGVVADLPADALFQRLVERDPVAQLDEQHDADVAVPFLADGQRLEHVGNLLDLAIDFRRADAYAARIQHRVGTAENDEAAMARLRGEIAVGPDIGEMRVVGREIFLAVGIVPEAERHRWKRAGADQFALFLDLGRLAVGGEDVGCHAERRALQFAAPHRPKRVAGGEAGEQIGAARHRKQEHVALHLLIDEVEALGRQRRSGRAQGAHGRKLVALDRFEPRFVQRVEEFRRGAEEA